MTRVPAILCLDRDPTMAEARRLHPGERTLRITDDLGGPAGTAVGIVGDADVDHAIRAAQRGWNLVVRLDLRGEHRRLVLEDLDRLGILIDATAFDGRPVLDPVDERLLNQLAAGATLRDAARAVGVSDRSAARRLAALRAALGVATTAGVLARCRGLAPTS
jgi:hypothetical protein